MTNRFISTIRELMGVSEENITTQGVHPIRQQYPELVGDTGISNTVKQSWQITDIVPLAFVAFFFFSLVWSFGYYKPMQRILKLNENIATLSRVFDDRADQVLRASTELRQFIMDNELPEAAITRIDELQENVSKLALEKPSDTTIKKRFIAEAKFSKLARQITKHRDLSVYGKLEPLPGDFTEQDMSARGRETIATAEQWLDVLTPQEKEAKELLGEFLDKPMPKREGELRRFILSEWKTKHQKLLEQWKALKTQELHWKEFLSARQDREQKQAERQSMIDEQRIELDAKIKDNQAAIEAERARLSSGRKKPLAPAKPKQQIHRPTKKIESELERRKKAAAKLLD